MSGDFSYVRYLEAKRSVDDRAINRVVLEALRARLPTGKPLRILEIGGGTGSMVRRLLEWAVVGEAHYQLVDQDADAIERLPDLLTEWAAGADETTCAQTLAGSIELRRNECKLELHLERAEIGDFLTHCKGNYDLVLANAVLDLVDLSVLLPQLWKKCKPGALFWFTINFDGESIFLPPLADDEVIFEAYHLSMDRRTGSRYTGRSLWAALRNSHAAIVESGSSDWVVHGDESGYRGDEGYFLKHIIHTIEKELAGSEQLDGSKFARWVQARSQQVERGELVYIAHQLDFLGITQGNKG